MDRNDAPTDEAALTDKARRLRADVVAMHAEVQSKIKLRGQMANEWAQVACPLKVGDVVDNRGCTFTKRQGRVTKIQGSIGWHQEPMIRVFVVILKSDGTDSKNFSDWEYRA